MYKLVTVKDSVRVPPTLLGRETKESVQEALKIMEGRQDKDLGIVLAVTKVLDVGEGRIIFGDGGVYYDASYEMLVFNPEQNELVEGEVLDLAEFGAFIRVGPVDGLAHVSQITEDFMNYSKDGILTGKESKKTIKQGDKVRARIVTISTKQIQNAKVGLTMRQPGLGKLEWLEDAKKEKTPEAKPKKESKKEK
jgi:DNA-directed RNA polymerase subunit E'